MQKHNWKMLHNLDDNSHDFICLNCGKLDFMPIPDPEPTCIGPIAETIEKEIKAAEFIRASKQPAPVFRLNCWKCGQPQESITILLPHHHDQTGRYCPGSDTLARYFRDLCPACQTHGYREDCPICQGTYEVITPITIEIQKKMWDEDEWFDFTLKLTRESLSGYYLNVDDVIAAMYDGQTVRTKFSFFRCKPRINEPKEV